METPTPSAVGNYRDDMPFGIARLDGRGWELAYENLGKKVLLYRPRGGEKAGYFGTATLTDITFDSRAPRFLLLRLEAPEFFSQPIHPAIWHDPLEGKAYGADGKPIFSYFSIGIRPLTSQDQAALLKATTRLGYGGFEMPPAETDFVDQRFRAEREVLIRKTRFRNLVLNAYGPQCAVCSRDYGDPEQGVYEVEACHLQAVQHGGPDEITNAMAMCRHHHWAYDRGFFALSGAGRILIGKNMEAAMIEEFRGQQQATFPTDAQLWPRADRLAAHRTQFGFAEEAW